MQSNSDRDKEIPKKRKKLGMSCSRVGVVFRVYRRENFKRRQSFWKNELPLEQMDSKFFVECNANENFVESSEPLSQETISAKNRLVQYASMIRGLTAARHQWPWFTLTRKRVKFDEKGQPPSIFYPMFQVKDHQNRCKGCQESESFFCSIALSYKGVLMEVRQRNGNETEEMKKFFESMLKCADRHKCHELKEFMEYVLANSRRKYDGDNLYRVQFERLKRLETYLGYSISEKEKMEAKYTSRLGNRQAIFSHMHWKALSRNCHDGSRLQSHCKKNIEEAILLQQIERVKDNPVDFPNRLLCTEEVYVNRISNAVMMTCWVKAQLNEYRQQVADTDSSIAPDYEEESCRDMELRSAVGASIRLCNTRRRPWRKVSHRLPKTLAHLFVFASGPEMEKIHPTWYRALMSPSKVAEQDKRLIHSNKELERAIAAIEKELQYVQVKRRLKAHVLEART